MWSCEVQVTTSWRVWPRWNCYNFITLGTLLSMADILASTKFHATALISHGVVAIWVFFGCSWRDHLLNRLANCAICFGWWFCMLQSGPQRNVFQTSFFYFALITNRSYLCFNFGYFIQTKAMLSSMKLHGSVGYWFLLSLPHRTSWDGTSLSLFVGCV